MTGKVKSYLGLAQRSGAIVYGEDRILENLAKCRIVLVDAGATEKYRARLTAKCKGKPCFTVESLKDALHRDGVKSVAVTNENLASAITAELQTATISS